MPEIAYVNGEFLPLDKAFVHVEDRGFQFADAVYEAIRTYGGRPFALEEHLGRLSRSLAAIKLDPGVSAADLRGLIDECNRRAGFPESMIYLQISRGRAPRHRGFPSRTIPTIVLTVRAFVPHPEWLEDGIAAITVPDIRWGRCDVKSVGLLANCLAYQAAREAGANEAIFVTEAGIVTEATAANVFVVRAGSLLTPPNSADLLPGITRDKVLGAAGACRIPVCERAIPRSDLLTADEIFVSSTSAEVLPVVSVDKVKIGTGKPGGVSRQIYSKFLEMFTRG